MSAGARGLQIMQSQALLLSQDSSSEYEQIEQRVADQRTAMQRHERATDGLLRFARFVRTRKRACVEVFIAIALLVTGLNVFAVAALCALRDLPLGDIERDAYAVQANCEEHKPRIRKCLRLIRLAHLWQKSVAAVLCVAFVFSHYMLLRGTNASKSSWPGWCIFMEMLLGLVAVLSCGGSYTTCWMPVGKRTQRERAAFGSILACRICLLSISVPLSGEWQLGRNFSIFALGTWPGMVAVIGADLCLLLGLSFTLQPDFFFDGGMVLSAPQKELQMRSHVVSRGLYLRPRFDEIAAWLEHLAPLDHMEAAWRAFHAAERVHVLSTRFQGVHYFVAARVKLLLESRRQEVACFNPNTDNAAMAGQVAADANMIWLKRWREMLTLAARTGGCVLQICIVGEKLSDMQDAEADMAADKGVRVVQLSFEAPEGADEVSCGTVDAVLQSKMLSLEATLLERVEHRAPLLAEDYAALEVLLTHG